MSTAGLLASMMGNKKGEGEQSREGWRFAEQIQPDLDGREVIEYCKAGFGPALPV